MSGEHHDQPTSTPVQHVRHPAASFPVSNFCAPSIGSADDFPPRTNQPTYPRQAEIVSNLVQMWDNFLEYVRNRWNWLESLSLALLAGGLFVRVVDSDVHLGRALFALSAPLVFSRVLFFGQILRRQGLVIQVRVCVT